MSEFRDRAGLDRYGRNSVNPLSGQNLVTFGASDLSLILIVFAIQQADSGC